MTLPDLPAGRPIPDTDDLRLLAELINNVSIPLANAAWNARMSQPEAAARLISMAERGLPLRLVADGDRQALWHIAQAGPATSGVPVSAPVPVPSQSGAVGGSAALPVPEPGPIPDPASAPGQASVPGPGSVPVAGPAPAAGGPVVLPPTPPVPPHEQAIAGAVPLGQPPFGPSEPTPQVAEPAPPVPESGRHATAGDAADEPDRPLDQGEPAGALWGPPGTSWATTEDPAAAEAPDVTPEPPPAAPEQPPSLEQSAAPEQPAATEQPPAPEQPPAGAPQPSGPQPFAAPGPAVVPEPSARPVWASIPVAGPAGEQLVVTILDVLDPGDRVLTDAGYRMEPGQRAVLVHSSVANTGQVPYYPVGDLYLVLETDSRVLLGRANIAVATHPAFPVGVTPGRTADGWSVFLIPSETVLAGIKWCIRPDMPQTILSWPIAP